ncbi:MAG TPA: DNA internalization-related competence protein ComEC/Rec2 [Thermoanaerobaculia bacterium]|nr:DNA internalization-related competence protein ComEC/Rec2 [Thermoanaerobaculia bacterium]
MIRSWSHEAGAPAVPAAFAVAAGIVLAAVLPLPPTGALAALLAVAALLGIAVSFRGDRRLRVLGAFVLLALAGGARFLDGFLAPARRTEAAARALGEEASVEVTGRLDRLWSRSGSLYRARIEVEGASSGGRPLGLERPLALVVAGSDDPSETAEIGDRVRVRGPLRLPEGPASARSPFRFPAEPRLVLKSSGQIERLEGPAGPFGPVQALHAAAKRRLRSNLAGASDGDRRAVALLLAFLMGETADLPAETVTAFRDGGVAHIVAISGLQVALVATGLAFLLGRFRLRVAARDAALLVATLLFAVFAGGRPPVVRAALMIGLYLLARLLGRPTSPGQVVGFAALVLLLLGPEDLFDIGFLLTFAAVFGLSAFGAPLARRLREAGWRPGFAVDAAAATLGAEIAVFPVQAFVFNVVPFVGLLSNPVVVPLSIVFLYAALALAPLLLISPVTAAAAVAPLRLLADAMVGLLTALDGLSALRVVPTPPFLLAAGTALLLLAAGTARRALARRVTFAGALLAMLFVLVHRIPAAEDGTARVEAIDVGQGDSWLLVSPAGRVLVDGGGSWDRAYETGRLRLLPKLCDRGAVSLDAVVLTHPHPDHARGLLAVLTLLPVREVVLPATAPRNEVLDEFLEAARRRSLPLRRLAAGDRFSAGGFDFDVLHPAGHAYLRSPENNGSLVLRTALPGRTLLLTGDVEAPAERDLLDAGRPLQADILKVAHHGSSTSTTPELLRAVSPRVALVGVGRHNRFGHPSAVVLDRLGQARVRTLRTDRDGDVALLVRKGMIFPLFPEAFPGTPP